MFGLTPLSSRSIYIFQIEGKQIQNINHSISKRRKMTFYVGSGRHSMSVLEPI